jgi:hypothetical protein
VCKNNTPGMDKPLRTSGHLGGYEVPPPPTPRALYNFFAGLCAEPGCPRCGVPNIYILKSGLISRAMRSTRPWSSAACNS